jgi:hypothetical protein
MSIHRSVFPIQGAHKRGVTYEQQLGQPLDQHFTSQCRLSEGVYCSDDDVLDISDGDDSSDDDSDDGPVNPAPVKRVIGASERLYPGPKAVVTAGTGKAEPRCHFCYFETLYAEMRDVDGDN